MAVAALLHPQIAHAQRLAPQPLRPEQVAVALEHADDVVIAQLLRTDRTASHQQRGWKYLMHAE